MMMDFSKFTKVDYSEAYEDADSNFNKISSKPYSEQMKIINGNQMNSDSEQTAYMWEIVRCKVNARILESRKSKNGGIA